MKYVVSVVFYKLRDNVSFIIEIVWLKKKRKHLVLEIFPWNYELFTISFYECNFKEIPQIYFILNKSVYYAPTGKITGFWERVCVLTNQINN